MKTILLSTLLLTAFQIAAQEIKVPWNDGFEQLKTQDYFEHGTSSGVLSENGGVNNSKCIILNPETGKNIQAILKSVSVNPMQKYKLSFSAKCEGPDTFEQNTLLEQIFYDFSRANKGKPLPGWQLKFFDGNGKPVNRLRPVFFEAITHNKWTPYCEVFYPPLGAEKVAVIFTSNRNHENTIYVDDLKLEIADEGPFVNINPNLRYGPYNFSGYCLTRNARFVESPEGSGQYVLDGADNGLIQLDHIPLKNGQEYKVTAEMTAGLKTSRLTLSIMDKDNKQVYVGKENLRVRPNQSAVLTMNFVALDGQSYAAPVIKDAIVKSIKVEEVKGE